jgi:ParB family chromosome partitioning protein
MGKSDDIRRAAGANIDDSIGLNRSARPAETSAAPARWQGVKPLGNAREIDLSKVIPDPDQPRQEFDPEEMARITESVRSRGVLQPIRVRWDEGQGMYVVIAGERRLRASREALRPTIPCIVHDGPIAPGDLLAIQLLENCLREGLKPVEQARAFKSLIEAHGWTITRVAQELGMDQSSVSKKIALLDIPLSVQEHVESGALAASVAYEVGKIEDPDVQREVADRIVARDMNRAEAIQEVNQARATVRKATPGKGRGAKSGPPKPKVFRTAGAKVTVELKRAGDVAAIRAALAEAMGQLDAAGEGRGEAAA